MTRHASTFDTPGTCGSKEALCRGASLRSGDTGTPTLERRECARTPRPGAIAVAARGASLLETTLVEYNTQGARIVLDGQARLNQRLDFELTTGRGCLEGYARVAWTAATSNGRQVAGLEFIDFTLHTRLG